MISRKYPSYSSLEHTRNEFDMTARKPRVELVPWNYASSEHVERMYLQRLGCGWRSDEVHEKWTSLGREGQKTMYWVVSTCIALLIT